MEATTSPDRAFTIPTLKANCTVVIFEPEKTQKKYFLVTGGHYQISIYSGKEVLYYMLHIFLHIVAQNIDNFFTLSPVTFDFVDVFLASCSQNTLQNYLYVRDDYDHHL